MVHGIHPVGPLPVMYAGPLRLRSWSDPSWLDLAPHHPLTRTDGRAGRRMGAEVCFQNFQGKENPPGAWNGTTIQTRLWNSIISTIVQNTFCDPCPAAPRQVPCIYGFHIYRPFLLNEHHRKEDRRHRQAQQVEEARVVGAGGSVGVDQGGSQICSTQES